MFHEKSILALGGGVALVALFLTSGCASIVSKSTYPVFISTNAPDATVAVRDAKQQIVASGKAPLYALLDAGDGFFANASYYCEVIDSKYGSRTQILSAKFDPWFIGNLVFGGLIGMVIDGATGAMFKLPPRFQINYDEYLTPAALKNEPVTEIKNE